MLLNYLAGRTFNNPNFYPVLPWVKDFTSKDGGWRDLTQSNNRDGVGNMYIGDRGTHVTAGTENGEAIRTQQQGGRGDR